ncbi:MAG: replicative DNA helicase [Eubacteriales bacterium]|nr:replicative DNA helicase [Eubacteriales bacterium]MDD3350421.1 replicative DNA helicase [Eubacteriales bacterium]
MSQMERIPPHSNEAEKSVLGSILLDKEAFYEVMELLSDEDFYSEMHREIYRAAIGLYRRNEPVDILTVSEELKKRNTLEMVGGRAYVATLSTLVPSTSNVVQYAKIVGEKAVLRKLITAASGIMDKAYQEKVEPEEILNFAEKSVFEIAQSRQKRDFEPLKDVLYENLKRIDEVSKLSGGITGVTTGFVVLDARTSGFQRSDLVILAARPSMGKTALALNIAQQAALRAKAKVLIFSLEMSREQLGQRLLSMEARVEMQKIKTGKLDGSDFEKINDAVDRLAAAEIFIDDTPGISVIEIKNKCRRLKAEKGLDLIVVDYLQLMAVDGRTESRQQEITALSRFLKQLAREMDCPVLVLSQLSRAPEQRADHRPILSDLRESGAIEQDADIVMFLYRDEYYNENTEKPNICEVNTAKQRSGSTGTDELAWLGKYTRFADASRLKD